MLANSIGIAFRGIDQDNSFFAAAAASSMLSHTRARARARWRARCGRKKEKKVQWEKSK